ncbi:MAG TPA: transcriptional regulator [Bacteroidales bacterium]|nr:transcriptional regulator [Bacteroidales bacterium]
MNNQFINLELQANDFRQQNGLNLTEAIRIKSLVQKLNILTVFLPLGNDFSGMAVKLDSAEDPKRFLLINCNHTIGRQHFTICHELYHLYYQIDFKSEKSNAGTFNKNGDPGEYRADIFASFLLIPTNGVLQLIPENERKKNRITLKTILSIEHYYSCSRIALLNRLFNMKLIDSEVILEHKKDIIKYATLYGYNTDLYQPGNNDMVIGDYGSLARELFDRGIVSESSYFTLLEDLGIDLSQLDHLHNNE